jgi:hypothetical protein
VVVAQPPAQAVARIAAVANTGALAVGGASSDSVLVTVDNCGAIAARTTTSHPPIVAAAPTDLVAAAAPSPFVAACAPDARMDLPSFTLSPTCAQFPLPAHAARAPAAAASPLPRPPPPLASPSPPPRPPPPPPAPRCIAKLTDPWLSLALLPPDAAGGPWSPEAAEKLGASTGADVHHLPPELLLTGSLQPSSDVYSLAMLSEWLWGPCSVTRCST